MNVLSFVLCKQKFVAVLQINLHARSAEVLDVESDTDTPREVSVILNEVVHANVKLYSSKCKECELTVVSENTATFSI